MPLGLLAVRLGDARNPAAVVSRGRADAADEAVRWQVRIGGAGSIDKPGFHQRLGIGALTFYPFASTAPSGHLWSQHRHPDPASAQPITGGASDATIADNDNVTRILVRPSQGRQCDCGPRKDERIVVIQAMLGGGG